MRLILDRATRAAATAATSALILTLCAGLAAADTPAQGQPAFSSQPLPAVPGAPAAAKGHRPRVGLVLAAKQLRKVVMRDEDYYD